MGRRIGHTTEAFVEALEALENWHSEGACGTLDPMSILQMRTPRDQVRNAGALAEVIDRHHACTCHTDPDTCIATWNRERAGLPALVGVGSVCRLGKRGLDECERGG